MLALFTFVSSSATRKTACAAIAGLFMALAAIGAAPSPAKAAVLNVSSSGRLLGAQNVDVNGALYDVAFQDGSCVGLFNGCDNPATDFAFSTLADATNAANALLDQVFVDGPQGYFDSAPALTAGCGGWVSSCGVFIPYDLAPPPLFSALEVYNDRFLAPDGILEFKLSRTYDTTIPANRTFAVFTPAAAVPEPASALLFGVGLVGLGMIRRRRGAVR